MTDVIKYKRIVSALGNQSQGDETNETEEILRRRKAIEASKVEEKKHKAVIEGYLPPPCCVVADLAFDILIGITSFFLLTEKFV